MFHGFFMDQSAALFQFSGDTFIGIKDKFAFEEINIIAKAAPVIHR